MPFGAERVLSLSQTTRLVNQVTVDDIFQKTHSSLVLYLFLDGRHEYVVIDAVKEFPYIAFEHKAWFRVITAQFPDGISEICYAFMVPLADAAGKGIWYESRIEYWIQDRKNSVMKHPVAHCCFENMSAFRIAYPEIMIPPMPVRSTLKIAVQSKDFLFKLPLEPCHVEPVALVSFECIPCRKKIFRRYY